jgi:2-polyprenyl-3-methyl-5-hydroxy-6-metoxy-1,4-benzoquinol methylase
MNVELLEDSTGVALEARVACPSCAGQDAQMLSSAPDRFNGRHVSYDLKKCTRCSLVWTANAPRPEEMAQHYGSEYDRAVTTAGESLARFEWRREQLAQYKTTGSVLDIGCSSGSFLYCMQRAGWDVSGIEMSRAAAEAAEARCGAKVFIGYISEAEYKPGTFDAITAFHVLEHAYSPTDMLRRVHRWLKPGGVFYMMSPNIDSAGFRVFGSYWFALELPRHLFHFSPASLTYMANSVGLEALSVKLGREPFIENSVRYIVDAGLEKVGIRRRPLANATHPGLAKRILRKAVRKTILPLASLPMRLAGPGESIHAFFQRPL